MLMSSLKSDGTHVESSTASIINIAALKLAKAQLQGKVEDESLIFHVPRTNGFSFNSIFWSFVWI